MRRLLALVTVLSVSLSVLNAAEGTYAGTYAGEYQWGKRKADALTAVVTQADKDGQFSVVFTATWKDKPSEYAGTMEVAADGKVSGWCAVKKDKKPWKLTGTLVKGTVSAQFSSPEGDGWKSEGQLTMTLQEP